MSEDVPKGAFISSPDALWTYRRMVSWLECPYLRSPAKRKRRELLIAEHGINDPWILSMMFGRFMQSNEANLVFEQHHIEAAKRAMRGEGTPIKGPQMASIDFSGGLDAQAVMFAEGTDIQSSEDHHEPNEIILARQLVLRFQAMGIQPFNVVVDGGGLGSTCIKYMESAPPNGCGFVGVRKYLNNRRARLPKVFFDRYTEDHFRLRHMLVSGVMKLPESEELLKQMRNRRYIIAESMKIKMELKENIRKRGMRSPDLLDDLVMIISNIQIEGFDNLYEEDKKDHHKTWEEQSKNKGASGDRLGKIFSKPGSTGPVHFGRRGKSFLPRK